MNKTLLTIFSTAACVGSAFAVAPTPVLYDNAAFYGFSADGRFAVSELNGTMIIFDLQTGDETVYPEDGINYYSRGYGNFITADGSVIVGSTIQSADAAYCDATGWHQLQVPDENKVNVSHGITPDGSRICGNVGAHEITLSEDVIMQIPVYWDRNEDGTYGEYHVLPYPTEDFFGATPQYLTAIDISPDGKTIAGQMQDCRGMMAVPIVYTQDEKGDWSYSFPTKDLFNPDGYEQVANPGDCPSMPSQESFMTEEEISEYQQALQAYYDSGYTLPYPAYEDYMTAAEQEAYAAAKSEWDKEYDVWSEKWKAYDDYYMNVMETSPVFLLNSQLMSPEGTSLAVSVETTIDDPDSWFGYRIVYTPWVIDLATNQIMKYESEKSMNISCFANDGVLLAGSERGSVPMEGYVLKDGTVTSIFDFINDLSPEYGDWIKKNMTHEISEYEYDEDTEDWVEVYKEVLFTGIPVATPDLKKLSFWTDAFYWNYDLEAQGVIFDLAALGGVDDVVAVNCGVAFEGGNLQVTGVAETLAVYDVTGVCLKSVTGAQGTVALDLQHGVYVVKATFAGGVEKVLKIAK